MERKVKYDYAFKLECVKLVTNEHYSCASVSNKKDTSESNIRKWVSFYREYGKVGLLPRRNRVYSIDFKQKVLLSIDRDSLSLREARLKFNIPTDSTIIKWKRDFVNFGLKGLEPKPKGRQKSMSNFKRKKRKSDKPLTREEELLLENEALRCELDFLKKLQALIQAEGKAKKRKS
ncbi:helix-turn-helix domain-containing protein [Flavobacterium sp. Arc2]|jgi:transposase|uniref:helix-turn-helix domain-containing protein n=1 Tax=Flavobacterium sp. Arc2 TaxID=3046685 RepID=UPI00352D711E